MTWIYVVIFGPNLIVEQLWNSRNQAHRHKYPREAHTCIIQRQRCLLKTIWLTNSISTLKKIINFKPRGAYFYELNSCNVFSQKTDTIHRNLNSFTFVSRSSWINNFWKQLQKISILRQSLKVTWLIKTVRVWKKKNLITDIYIFQISLYFMRDIKTV